MFPHIAVAAAVVAIVTGAAWHVAEAQDKVEPKGVVAYRIAVMRTLGAQMMAIKTALTETPDFADNIVWHGQIVNDASKLVLDLFPKGSNEPPSRTLDVVWEKWGEFEAAAKKLTEMSAAFVETAKGGDRQATMKAFAEMGKQACGGCHETFRQKQE